jgi:hypothetical protein
LIVTNVVLFFIFIRIFPNGQFVCRFEIRGKYQSLKFFSQFIINNFIK